MQLFVPPAHNKLTGELKNLNITRAWRECAVLTRRLTTYSDRASTCFGGTSFALPPQIRFL
jgi:hypothetical protein